MATEIYYIKIVRLIKEINNSFVQMALIYYSNFSFAVFVIGLERVYSGFVLKCKMQT